MTFLQALLYFIKEAAMNLIRGWKVSLLAILTIAVSLFLGGVFLLISGNLRLLIEGWEKESKLVVYLEEGVELETKNQLLQDLQRSSQVAEVQEIDREIAEQRFRSAFPSMADLLEGWGESPLPESLEIQLQSDPPLEAADVEPWLQELRQDPAVLMIDDDRDWLGQLETVVIVLEGMGTVLGGILLFTAIFTISSVIRLTAYLYRDEITVMRLVGATEFFIRGPFYVEGLFQGLAGSLLAAGALFAAFRFADQGQDSPLASLLTSSFLPMGQILLLIGLGCAAGLIGAVTSLHRESLASGEEEASEWAESEE